MKEIYKENINGEEYIILYKGLLKDTQVFESIYWLFSMKWIDSNVTSPTLKSLYYFFIYNVSNKLGTAITLNDLDNNNSFFSEKMILIAI